MSSHLTPAERDELLAALNARLAALEAGRCGLLEGRSRAEHARELLLQDGDDAPQRDADREVDLATTDRQVVDLAAVQAALARLAAGTYGDCADCGDEIPLARLRLEPAALRCVACASRQERLQPRPASL
jgi:DnaK suppressor protein